MVSPTETSGGMVDASDATNSVLSGAAGTIAMLLAVGLICIALVVVGRRVLGPLGAVVGVVLAGVILISTVVALVS